MRRALLTPSFCRISLLPIVNLLSSVTSCCATFFETNNYDPGH